MTQDTYLVTSEDIAAMDGVTKTHFLNTNATRVNKSLGDMTGLTGFGFHIIEIEPGQETTEHHMHYHEDECIYVLDGTATAIVGEDRFTIKPGDFVGYRKNGQAHSVVNTGDVPFRCIVVGQRLDHDVADYTRLQKRIFRQKGLPYNLVDIDQIEVPDSGVGKK